MLVDEAYGFCLVNNITVKFLLVYELTADERARAVADITRMLEANSLKHNVARTFPLADIVAAHEVPLLPAQLP